MGTKARPSVTWNGISLVECISYIIHSLPKVDEEDFFCFSC